MEELECFGSQETLILELEEKTGDEGRGRHHSRQKGKKHSGGGILSLGVGDGNPSASLSSLHLLTSSEEISVPAGRDRREKGKHPRHPSSSSSASSSALADGVEGGGGMLERKRSAGERSENSDVGGERKKRRRRPRKRGKGRSRSRKEGETGGKDS